jgi:hypothetical protein
MKLKLRRTKYSFLTQVVVTILGQLTTPVAFAQFEEPDNGPLFGEIADFPERDPDAEAIAKRSPAYRKALEKARKKLCVQGRQQFPLDWDGALELHGCNKEATYCYDDFKLVKPGTTWKCGKERCQCEGDGNVSRASLKKNP